MAARLAREHGGRDRNWQRAMTEARGLYHPHQGRTKRAGENVATPESGP